MTEDLFWDVYGVIRDAEHYRVCGPVERLAYLYRRADLLERLAADSPELEQIASDARDRATRAEQQMTQDRKPLNNHDRQCH